MGEKPRRKPGGKGRNGRFIPGYSHRYSLLPTVIPVLLLSQPTVKQALNLNFLIKLSKPGITQE